MSELLPGVQGPRIQDSILDYLSTTFSLAEQDAGSALVDFLSDRENGIFKGPYLRARLPFRPADNGWRENLEWYKGFPPYGHQAEAFKRLSSFNLSESKPRPLPTVLTTGTGSGKTEAFFVPVIDHVLRAKRRGITGTKAIFLYPMNALANDQAKRLAEIITTYPELAGVTAGIYTGQNVKIRTKVSADSLITDRDVLRSDPPDILLTNYKMLDQLLLRKTDSKIWELSAKSLQYLVLDEFHTYDGAQGTDVAMLIRRLGIALKSYWSDDDFSPADRARPLGIVTPVATSATLGDKGDPGEILEFAETVFGEAFEEDSVITESRMSIEEWLGEPAPVIARTDKKAIENVVNKSLELSEGREIAEFVFSEMFEPETENSINISQASSEILLNLAKAHPFTGAIAEHAAGAISIHELAKKILPSICVDEQSTELAESFLMVYSAALSHVRKAVGRGALSIDLHLWVRELSRIDRVTSGIAQYLWSDDGQLGAGEYGNVAEAGSHAFPAIYCIHCGRSGWGVLRAPAGGLDLTSASSSDTRRASLMNSGDFRALIHAPREAIIAAEGKPANVEDPDAAQLLWFNPLELRLLTKMPDEDEGVATSKVLPVLAFIGKHASEYSTGDRCPACHQSGGIRFLGAAIATLLSVSLSTIFGNEKLDKTEKKALIFTDSVQDAAHRAGFIQTRSHVLTLRSVMRNAIDEGRVSLEELPQRIIQQAGDDKHRRYVLVPSTLAERKEFSGFWNSETRSKVEPKVLARVKRKLLFDSVLEFGLQSMLGRTLERTGSVAAGVLVSDKALLRAVDRVLKKANIDHLEAQKLTDEEKVGWARGVLERMRSRGAIGHEWFRRYQKEDGSRFSIWGGRPKADGMPAFPYARSAPEYPRIGGKNSKNSSDLINIGSAKGWYANWTSKVFACNPAEGASLVVSLFDELAESDIIKTVNTDSGGRVFEIPASSVVLEPTSDEKYSAGSYLISCDDCGFPIPGTEEVTSQLNGMPCFARRCSGTFKQSPGESDNFYRRFYQSKDVLRVVAREHTGMVEDEVRIEYENQFKASAVEPQAPNVLVATPTLEMGIDIGDLSTVILSSLPKSVASYLQRVGRAGRLTGSALNLAFVSGRGEQLPRLGDPLSVIDGEVRPPATYIDAEEILRRQYLASVADIIARSSDGPHPSNATEAIGSIDEGSFLHSLIIGGEKTENLDSFLSAFDQLSEQSRANLKQWSAPISDPLTSELATHVIEQKQRWSLQRETLLFRKKEIEESLPELQERAELPAATEDDKTAWKTAKAALKLVKHQLYELTEKHWISVLEEHGILPNYTLLDDSVTLDVTFSWMDPDTNDFQSESATFNRGAAIALRDFAPGSTFYSRGAKILVDAVDIGDKGESIKTWIFCASCGYGEPHGEKVSVNSCPRCGDPKFSDLKQRIDVVEMERVSSAMSRDDASIDDGRDERERVPFQIITAADIHEPKHQWFVEDYDFGLKYLTNMTIRWLNVGKRFDNASATGYFGGQEFELPLFRVCVGCGKIDRQTGLNTPAEHRPWCDYRKEAHENIRQIALGRTLRTEGVSIRLPASVTLGDQFGTPSIIAALRLGLREHVGGAPDHLSFEQIVDPYLSDGSENSTAVLIHDLVPGGTGYLAEFADPEKFYTLLYRAWEIVRDCQCQEEGRLSCHRCLSPFIQAETQKLVSRVVAERYLRMILLGGESEGEPSESMTWKVTEKQAAPFDKETHIEQKFRNVLRERLTKGLGFGINEVPASVGNRWSINATGGLIWTLEPQMQIDGVMPDFVLICNNPSVPRLAIFCDGWAFHATPSINRISDDAKKRQGLRDQGYAVVGVTWSDLVSAEEGKINRPLWFSDNAWQMAMQASGGKLKPGLRELVEGGPIDFIASWISKPDPEGVEALADVLPLLFAGNGAAGKSSAEKSLSGLAKEFHEGGGLSEDGELNVWSYSRDTLTILARNVGTTSFSTQVVVLLDDREDRVGKQHQAAWEEWIRISNLLNFRTQETNITSHSLANKFEGKPTIVGVTLDPQWTELHGLVFTQEQKDLIVELSGLGVPAPVIGYETNRGLAIDISWPDRQIAVDLDLDVDEQKELTDQEWKLVKPQPQEIAKLFAETGE